ncbi:MAG: protein kinase, partial [Planctomycetota bacterium]
MSREHRSPEGAEESEFEDSLAHALDRGMAFALGGEENPCSPLGSSGLSHGSLRDLSSAASMVGEGGEAGDSDRYQIIGPIKTEGPYRVFLARDLELGRSVAIRRQAPGTADSESGATDLDCEARLRSRLQHSGISSIYDCATDSEGPFVVMQWVEGMSLRDSVHKHRLVASQRLPIYESIVRAMGHAHSRGVAHGDLRPENVILGDHGEVQIVGWALARDLDLGGCDAAAKDIALLGALFEWLFPDGGAADLAALATRCQGPM